MTEQTPDTQPGNYYVSIMDGPSKVLALGPFVNNHQAALDMVDKVRQYVNEHDTYGFWYAYGTARTELDWAPTGRLNDVFILEVVG